jgi:hypothetical protein
MLAEAIFKESPTAVVEAYSSFEQELREFRSSEEICAYAKAHRGSNNASVHLAVLYADMAGTLTRTRIELNANNCGGHTYRYKAEGWGLIWVLLELQQSSVGSFVSANSEKRAKAWAATYPDMESPAMWHWPAVARHLRRLRRVLKLAA